MSAVTVKWIDGVAFVAETQTGHALVMDGAPENGGRNLGPRPMEMLLVGLGGCTAFDVVTMLQKARQDVVDCQVEVTAERAEAVPKVFTRIHVHFRIFGDVAENHARRAVGLSAEKYCSASRMLAASAEITHDFEIVAGHARGSK